jgi:hypothetical protein
MFYAFFPSLEEFCSEFNDATLVVLLATLTKASWIPWGSPQLIPSNNESIIDGNMDIHDYTCYIRY